jgi:hypothetical protein
MTDVVGASLGGATVTRAQRARLDDRIGLQPHARAHQHRFGVGFAFTDVSRNELSLDSSRLNKSVHAILDGRFGDDVRLRRAHAHETCCGTTQLLSHAFRV